MSDPVQVPSLPAQDDRLVRRMAAASGVSAEVMAREIIRSYLRLVRSAPEALPDDPMRRLTSTAIRGGRRDG